MSSDEHADGDRACRGQVGEKLSIVSSRSASARGGTPRSAPDGGRHQFCSGAPSARPSGQAALRRRQCHLVSEMLPSEHMRRLPRHPALRHGRMAHGRCHGVPSRAWAEHTGCLHDAGYRDAKLYKQYRRQLATPAPGRDAKCLDWISRRAGSPPVDRGRRICEQYTFTSVGTFTLAVMINAFAQRANASLLGAHDLTRDRCNDTMDARHYPALVPAQVGDLVRALI